MELLIAGDFYFQNRPRLLFESGDSSFLDPIRSIDADYKVLNFESSLTDRDLYPIIKKGVCLKSPSSALKALQYSGFSCVTLANNHFMDYGVSGYEDSIRLFSQFGIDYVGVGSSVSEASRPLIKCFGSYKLAFINCCEHEFSIATESKAGCNPLDHISLYYQIKRLRSQVDYIFVIIHGGFEHFQHPSPRMIKTYRFLIDAGADSVINHHQHCYCGYEVYHGRPIFYGIGNFIFDSAFNEDDSFFEGFLIKFSITNKLSFQIIPYYQCKGDTVFRFMDDTEKTSFDDKINYLNFCFSHADQYEEIIRTYRESIVYGNDSILTPYITRVGKSLYNRHILPPFFKEQRTLSLYNNVMCESHLERLQWLLEYSLNNY